jgi:hypothetical protein
VEKVCLSAVNPALAAQLSAGVECRDPYGIMDAAHLRESMRASQCYLADAGHGGKAIYALQVHNGVALIASLKGYGSVPWVEVLAPIIENQVQGCRAVALQTARRGLVRKMEKQGYKITGYIMRKELQ